MAFLELRNVSKSFAGTRALDGIDLDVEQGEFCVLLGPSGCGKSTLLNTIAGLEAQDEGSIILDERPMEGLAPRDRDVAMVFQSYALYPHMTVFDNLAFGLKMRNAPRPEIRMRVLETARFLGIEDLLGRRPKALSGGQQQRVAMGRALVRRPALFLLDEPLSNLDARLRARVRMELKGLHKSVGGTFIYVTHDQVEAMTLGEKVVVMKGGRVHQVGTPEDIYMRPVDPFVAGFVGSPEMNLVRGEIVCGQDGARFEKNGFVVDLGDGHGATGPGGALLGIRPEDIVLLGAEHAGGLKARVEEVVDIGPEFYVDVRLAGQGIMVRAPKDLLFRTGDECCVRFKKGRIHLFQKGKRAGL